MTSDEASSIATPVEKVDRTINVRGIQTHMFEAGSPAAAPLLYIQASFSEIYGWCTTISLHRTFTFSRLIFPVSV